MHCRFRGALRLGGLAALLILLSAGSVGMASRVRAADPESGELFFMLYPENDEKPYACVGKPFKGFFMAGVEKELSDSDPLAPLVPPEISVNTDTPKVGTLSQRSWTVKSGKVIWWTYTPTKVGDEDLLFDASIPKSSYKPITTETRFPVLNCQYRLSIHAEIRNTQGAIETNMFYDAEGHFDIIQKGRNSPFTFKGYGATSIQAFSDGTEGGVKCITSKPGEGTGNLHIEGSVDPSSSNINLTLRFSDTGSGVGQTCSKGDKTGPGMIRHIGFLPSGKTEGELTDIKFSPFGDNQELEINAFNDRRWVKGLNQGSMLITVVPVTSK